MINSTPKKHYSLQKTKQRTLNGVSPSKYSISLIMGYAAAVRVLSTSYLGRTNVMLN